MLHFSMLWIKIEIGLEDRQTHARLTASFLEQPG